MVRWSSLESTVQADRGFSGLLVKRIPSRLEQPHAEWSQPVGPIAGRIDRYDEVRVVLERAGQYDTDADDGRQNGR